MKIPFLGGAYEGRSSNVSPETCINLFYEKGVNGEALVGTPGAKIASSGLILDSSSGQYVTEVRGGIDYNDLAYFVIGDALWEIKSGGGTATGYSATKRGTLNTSSGRVSMAHNGVRTSGNQQIMIVDGANGYIYDNSTSTLSEITDSNFVSAKTVTFLDGYFIFNEDNGSGRFWLTNQYDGTTIDSTDFATAEGSPDKLLSVLADNRQLFLFGEQTLEVWYNSGDADNTFQRYQGGFKQHGCLAAFSPARFDNSVVWLSRNERGVAQVVRLGEGYMPQIISTQEIDYQFSRYKNPGAAFSYVYQHEGHEFYVITFPDDNATWAYDAATQMWHRRAHNISSNFPDRERYNCHVYALGQHLLGDFANGNIYRLDHTIGTFEENSGDVSVERERTTFPVANEENRVRISSLQLDMEEGMGDGSVTDDDVFWLSYSKNGGHSFTNETARNAGDGGQWAKRVIWRRLGWGRNWIFRIRTWTTKRPVLKGLIAKLYGEPNK
jgi:hypothetical protein